MKIKNTIITGLTALALATGCKDEKLKECMAKTESLEQEFEELCEEDSKWGCLHTGNLYSLVKKRDEAWKEAGCSQYQARWICKHHLNLDGLFTATHYYTAERDYGSKEEMKK